MRAVAIAVHRVRRVKVGAVQNLIHPAKVPAPIIIHIAVAVIINSVARNFAGIHPHVVGQVFMQIVHARINDRDNHFAGARGDVPRFLRQNGARHIVVICPLFDEARIVRLALGANNVVRFRITDVWIGPESC